MRIDKCCDRVRLPGGERKWRRMARLAKFDGTVRIRGYFKSNKVKGLWDSARYFPNSIIVRVPHSCGVRPDTSVDPLDNYGHELGHHIRFVGGRKWATDYAFKTYREYSRQPVERACDRYSRILRAKT